MTNSQPAQTAPFPGIIVTVLIAAFTLAACLGDSGANAPIAAATDAASDPTPAAPTPAPGFPAPSPIPAAPIGASIGAGSGGGILVTTDTTGMQAGDAVQIASTGGAYGTCATCYDGTFIISNVVASSAPGNFDGSFEVAITFASPVGGATTQIVAGGTPPACITQEVVAGDGTFIPTVSISASRYQGVAPLGVFFDTAGTTATVTSRPFHELDYQWDFDEGNVDPTIGNWGDKSTGSSGSGANTSRRTDAGPVAAHVYEKPGTYRVKLTVRDAQGHAVTNNCVQIAVLDPDVAFAGKTACFSNSADFTGCPASVPLAARFTTTDFVTAMANDVTYKRLLFKRGDTFDVPSRVRMQAAGPGHVGAFGAGAAPKVRLTYNGDIFQPGGTGFSDWRIVDLELDLNAAAAVAAGGVAGDAHRAMRSVGEMGDIVMQRLYIHDGLQGYVLSSTVAPDKIFITDVTFENLLSNPTNGQAIYLAGNRIGYMGNRVYRTRSHNARFPFLVGAVLSHNFHETPGYGITTGVANMRVLGPNNVDYPGTFTDKVVVSSNKFVSGSFWMLEVQPQSNHNDERIKNVIAERNLFRPAAGFGWGSHVMTISGSNITVRNNILDLTIAGQAFRVGQWGDCAVQCEPLPENVDIFNNTIYNGTTPSGSTLKLIELDSKIAAPVLPSVWGVRVMNNLGYAPFQPSSGQVPQLIDDRATGTIISGNSANSDLLNTNPGFAADFSLTGAYPVAGDATVPVMSDFFGAVRAKPGAGTVGADQFP